MNPISSHATVLLDEAIAALNIRPAGTYVDGTFGRGGHSRRILQALSEAGRLIAIDRDLEAVRVGQAIIDQRLSVLQGGFSELGRLLREQGITQVDGILLDIGVSSPQLDQAQRGFSFRFDGPLDMRMDTSSGETAAEWLATAEEKQLWEVIKNYGEERFAKQVAKAIVTAREQSPIATTRQLAEIVAKAFQKREPNKDPATRTFQAIRIHINRELEELSLVLPQCVDLLASGGRLVVISFHSLEDRIVKRFIRSEANPDTLPSRLPVRSHELVQPRLSPVGRAVHASEEEIRVNPRARSAVMRVAERMSWPG